MTKISKNPNQIPKWFNINRELIPDFIVIDPKKSPVWEITVNILIDLFFPHNFSTKIYRVLNFRNRNNILPMVSQFDFLV
jgi:DNA ligase-3